MAKTSEYYYGSVIVQEKGKRSELTSRAYASISYSLKNEAGEELKITMEYDPVDKLISQIYLKGDVEDGKYFLENIFPYFVQETYFTEDEMNTLFAPSLEAYEKQDTLNAEEDEHISDNVYLSNHAKFNLSVDTMVGADYKYISLRLKSTGYYW